MMGLFGAAVVIGGVFSAARKEVDFGALPQAGQRDDRAADASGVTKR
jgi:hypothetical protein